MDWNWNKESVINLESLERNDSAYKFYVLGYLRIKKLINNELSNIALEKWNQIGSDLFESCLRQTTFALNLFKEDKRPEIAKMAIDSICSFAYRIQGSHPIIRNFVLAGFTTIYPNLLLELYKEEFGEIVVPVAQQQAVLWHIDNKKEMHHNNRPMMITNNLQQAPTPKVEKANNNEEIFQMIYSGDFSIREGWELYGLNTYNNFYRMYKRWEQEKGFDPKIFKTTKKSSIKKDKKEEDADIKLMKKAEEENAAYIEKQKNFRQQPEVPRPLWKTNFSKPYNRKPKDYKVAGIKR